MQNQRLNGSLPNASPLLPPGFEAARAAMDGANPFGLRVEDLDQQLATQDRSDVGNALRFKARFGDRFCYRLGAGKWLYWDGCRWADDMENHHVREAMAVTAASIFLEADYLEDNTERAALKRWSTTSRYDHRINAALHMAEVYVWRHDREFDQQPLWLNTLSGTVDLESGILRPHSKADGLTRLAPVPFDPRATCPTWLRFLEDVTGQRWEDERDPADDALEGLQRLLGYAMTGMTREHVMAIFHGAGSNGKSLLLDIVGQVLGDYAGTVRPEALMLQDQASSHQTDIVKLRGLRFVTASETEKDKALNEGLIKLLTGGDVVSAREIYSAAIEFRPEFKLFLATNHLPKIKGFDWGIWRRLVCVPFEATFVDAEDAKPGDRVKDPDLRRKLLAEAPGILAWLAWGARLYLRDGLRLPRRWKEVAGEYRTAQDAFGEFLQTCTLRERGARTPSGEIKAAFDRWAETEGIDTLSQRALALKLQERGFSLVRIGQARLVQGVKLRDEWAFALTGDGGL